MPDMTMCIDVQLEGESTEHLALKAQSLGTKAPSRASSVYRTRGEA